MQEKQITLQKNHHPREYIEELSSLYLLARSLHLAHSLKLPEKIAKTTITFEQLANIYPEYDPKGLQILIKYLSSFRIFNLAENNFSATELSDLSVLSELDSIQLQHWQKSYNIVEYLSANPTTINIFLKSDATIKVNNNSLIFNFENPKSMLLELAHLHLLSRSIRFATEIGLFDLLAKHTNGMTLDNLLVCLINNNSLKNSSSGFVNMLQILSRYEVINFVEEKKLIKTTKFTCYLCKEYPETMYPAMLIIDEKWWKAVAHLEKSFQIGSPSAFVYANQQDFYKAAANNPQLFAEGMAAISLLEDKDVAEANSELVKEYANLIDIAGGKGGLLASYYDKLKTESKKYVLFEKESDDTSCNEELKKSLQEHLVAKYGTDLKIEIKLGDFYKPETIPKYNNAAYFIKCVLHNVKKEESIKILKNVRAAMGDHCQFFLAERVVPNKISTPHINKMGNILMRMLFKADAYTTTYYQEILNEAGFDLKDVTVANNYLVFTTTEKPALRFTKKINSDTITTPFWQHGIENKLEKTEEINPISTNTFN